MRTFATCISTLLSMTAKNFNYLTEKLGDLYETCFSMCKATFKTRNGITSSDTNSIIIAQNESVNCQVFVYGTWQNHGHQPLNGTKTVISKKNG